MILKDNHKERKDLKEIFFMFYRTGLIERWGRGTNRVIAMCRDAGIPAPEFEEITGAAVVTFRVDVAGASQRTRQVTEQVAGQVGAKSQLESELESQLESELESLTRRVLTALRGGPLGKGFLARALGQKQASGPLHRAIRVLLAKGLIERTIPDKPNSRLQRYRLTTKGQNRGTL